MFFVFMVSRVSQAAVHRRLDKLTRESNKKCQDDAGIVLTFYFVDKRITSVKRFDD
jgi:hypothetical protein